MKIIVLGAGLIGGPMAADLAREPGFEISVADIHPAALSRLKARAPVGTIEADLSAPAAVRRVVQDFDLVLSAVPGFMGFETLRAVLEAGKKIVDISFFPEDPFALDALAREKRVTAVVDCGVAPGMSNILVGRAQSRLDAIASVLIYVGGLPEVREWPYDYKAGFSPADVIEEYTRPARYVQNGAVVIRPALSEPEFLDFPGIGTLEAFNTDGLRTLISTIPASDMKEKTLRYPGHIEKMAVLRETGFFGLEEIEMNGARVRPRDVTAKLLFPKWKLGPADRDITIMRVIVEGTASGGRRRRYTYELLDRFDRETGIHSMARTTGYTATMVVRMLARGLYSREGIIAPEFMGREPECVEFMLDGLKRRGVAYQETIRDL
jgi:saccharopine dehydrogenase-like NADP-dependent oxidoreductase